MNAGNITEHIALGMIERFDEAASWIAQELAEIEDALSDIVAAERWRDIADVIERRLLTP
jgi:hypothetical protein